jgi:hypothetical protein
LQREEAQAATGLTEEFGRMETKVFQAFTGDLYSI